MVQMMIQLKLNETFRKFADRVAIQYGDHSVTYNELEKRSTFIAAWLIKMGIKKETFIGIGLDCRMEFILVMIGILQAGCVFVPLDTAYPKSRLESLIRTTNITFVIGDQSNIDQLAGSEVLKKQGVEFIDVNDLKLRRKGFKDLFNEANARIQYSDNDIIYIYFTSGTTGIPKGIVGKNKELGHFINWEIGTFGIDETSRFSQFTNPGFDVFLRDIFTPLCSGGTICIPLNVPMEEEALKRWIDNQQINLIHCVPSLFRVLNTDSLEESYFRSLKYVLFAGEKVIPRELRNWYEIFGDRIRLVNLYGTAETGQAKMFYLIQPSDSKREIMPVGKHIKGARSIVLNDKMEPCKKLITGEIYIRTPYITFGYLNDPRLTSEKFIPNPFSNDPNDVLYKTGDLGRLLPDDNLEVLGRLDRQIKIRGMRVELDEIENTLLQHPSVKEAVVIKHEITEKNIFLAALITRIEKDGKNIEEDETIISKLRQYLSGKLPGYMMPNNITIIEQIPRKINGKVDYNEISGIVKKFGIDSDNRAPKNQVEKKLVETWSELLELEKIGTRTGFFEIGGNSLTVMSLITRIHKEFNVKISMGDIFKNITIEQQAKIIAASTKYRHVSIERVEKKEYYALSSAQKRIYIHCRMDIGGKSYNMPTVVVLNGELNIEILKDTFERLIRRHDSLRASFIVLEDETVQVIRNDVELNIALYENGEGDTHEIVKNFISPFDLSQAPLLRIGLIKMDGLKYVLMADMHHIISDQISHEVLVENFVALYSGRNLPSLRIQYRDFSEWQNRLFRTGEISKQENYWLNRFDGDIPVLNLPIDFFRPAVRRIDQGDHIHFVLEKQLSVKLFDIVKQRDATIYMVMLAAFNILLFKYTKNEDIVVGTPIAGRRHDDFKNVIGVFINMIAMRNHPGNNKTFAEFLKEVKKNALLAYENQDYPFDELVYKLGLHGSAAVNPLFDVEFAVSKRTIHREEPDIQGLKIEPYPNELKFAKFDLHFHVIEIGDKLQLLIRYSTALFKPSTIERILKHYLEILEQVVDNNAVKLRDITFTHDLLTVTPTFHRDDGSDFKF